MSRGTPEVSTPDREGREGARNETAGRILDTAQAMVQSRGYNGFSYRDVAERVGIQAATVHYYFATKGDLAAALVARYRKQMAQRRDALAKAPKRPLHKLKLYSSLFRDLLLDNEQLCLGAMLAAEAGSLPKKVVQETMGFFEDNVLWLSEVIENGRRSADFVFVGSSVGQARVFLATLEGAMLIARVSKDTEAFDSIAQAAIAQFSGHA